MGREREGRAKIVTRKRVVQTQSINYCTLRVWVHCYQKKILIVLYYLLTFSDKQDNNYMHCRLIFDRESQNSCTVVLWIHHSLIIKQFHITIYTETFEYIQTVRQKDTDIHTERYKDWHEVIDTYDYNISWQSYGTAYDVVLLTIPDAFAVSTAGLLVHWIAAWGEIPKADRVS